MCKTVSSKLPRSAMALSKVSLGAKQSSYIRKSVKAIVEKLMETSVTNALDKKVEWTKQIEDVEDTDDIQEFKVATRKKNCVVSDKCIHGLPVTIVSKNIKCLLVIKTI